MKEFDYINIKNIKKYKKESNYSYSFGAFPTLELINNKLNELIFVLISSKFNNFNVINDIKSKVSKDKIIFNDSLINKITDKENIYIVGVFNKYNMTLNPNKNHIILDNPQDMGNLGTILRSSLGFDFLNIGVIKPGVDIFSPKVIRSSMGAIFSLNIEYFDSLNDYKSMYKDHKIYSFMLNAKNSLKNVKFDLNKNITLAFGNEGSGLSGEYLDKDSIIIKHSNKIDSLNLTNAISIALYEVYSQVNNK